MKIYTKLLGILFALLVAMPSLAQTDETLTPSQMGQLAIDYYLGENGKPQDYTEAAKWYKKAAEQGDAQAQNNLGYCYENGQGVPQSYAEAFKWYKKAADNGDADAQCNLGVCYHNGDGVRKDKQIAIVWFKSAARNGNERAKEFLKKLGEDW